MTARAREPAKRASGAERKIDPREPDHSRSGIFVYHNCWKCQDGKNPCVNDSPWGCDYPRARND